MLADCGHESSPHGEHTTGTAYLVGRLGVGGRTMCWDCANAMEREAMLRTGRVVGYLSSDGRTITTWPGGKLAEVTRATERKVGFYGAMRTYLRAVDAYGRPWCGAAMGRGMLARLRLAKG